ncbi:MAG: DUF4293 domain-containing protein [Bacteroidales bacterium]|nr:DUF4293 domain-containing protein [Bacteroidales bacterium]
MIQRIQTLWLSLAAIVAISAFFFPIGNFVLSDQSIIFNLIPKPASIDSTSFYQQNPVWVLIILNIVFIVLSIISIFLYKNRQLQLKIVALAFLVLVAYTCYLFLYQVDAGLKDILAVFCKGREDLLKTYLDSYDISYGFASYCPIIQMLMLVFARNGIRKDEQLVRSSEHLR